jgi:hypothetical protein
VVPVDTLAVEPVTPEEQLIRVVEVVSLVTQPHL